jgi:hypothetical protein
MGHLSLSNLFKVFGVDQLRPPNRVRVPLGVSALVTAESSTLASAAIFTALLSPGLKVGENSLFVESALGNLAGNIGAQHGK